MSFIIFNAAKVPIMSHIVTPNGKHPQSNDSDVESDVSDPSDKKIESGDVNDVDVDAPPSVEEMDLIEERLANQTILIGNQQNLTKSKKSHIKMAIAHQSIFIGKFYHTLPKRSKDILFEVFNKKEPFFLSRTQADLVPLKFFDNDMADIFGEYFSRHSRHYRNKDKALGLQSCQNYFCAWKTYYTKHHPVCRNQNQSEAIAFQESNWKTHYWHMVGATKKQIASQGKLYSQPRQTMTANDALTIAITLFYRQELSLVMFTCFVSLLIQVRYQYLLNFILFFWPVLFMLLLLQLNIYFLLIFIAYLCRLVEEELRLLIVHSLTLSLENFKIMVIHVMCLK